MSLFGEPLPFEDETASSLIRRSGYPPQGTYNQMPEVYLCPCCNEFNREQERERLLREARDAKEAERRRLLQLDVFDERARPLPSGESRSKAYRRIVEDEEPVETAPSVPPPPPTLDELRRAKRDQNVPKLVVTVHHGRNISAKATDPISVIVRCGAFEGQTAKVPRGTEVLTPWEELFEFPYMNPNEPLEVLVVNDALPESNDQLVGGVVIPSAALHDRERGDQEPLPVMPEESMHNGYGTCKEGPLGTIVASWYVRNGDEKMDETAIEQQTLPNPLGCTFVAHRLFQYTDHGAEPYPGGVLCVLRDTDDNCSESVLYTPGPNAEPSLSPYHTKEGYHYLPENPSQIMQLNTEKKLGHILVCVPKQEEAAGDEEELLVIGAVPLDFERLYNKGSAVLLIESKSKDDALWGEISVEWANVPLDEEIPHPALLEVQKESLFVTVVRGLNLVNGDGEPIQNSCVTVATGELEGATVEALAVEDEDGNHVINWNQEVRFIEVNPNQRELEVQAFEKGRLISVGTCDLGTEDEGVIIIQMHRADDPTQPAGEIVVSYKRLHALRSGEDEARTRAAELAHEKAGHDEEDEEDEEREDTDHDGAHGESDADHEKAAQVGEGEEEEKEEEKEGEDEPVPADVEPVAEHSIGIDHDDSAEDEEREVDDYVQEEEQHVEEEQKEELHKSEELEEKETSACEEGEEQHEAEAEEQQEELHKSEELEEKETSACEEGEEQHEAEAEEQQEELHKSEELEEKDTSAGEEGEEQHHEEKKQGEANAGDEDEHDGEESSDANRDAGVKGGSEGKGEGYAEDEEQQEDYPKPGEEEEGKGEGAVGKPHNVHYAEEEEEQEELEAHDYEGEATERDHSAYSMPGANQQRHRMDWKPHNLKGCPDYKKPWYPSGNPLSEQHIPFEKTNLSKQNRESIRELETRRSRIEEESVRRGSTSRRSSTRGLSSGSQ